MRQAREEREIGQRRDQTASQHDPETADLVGQPPNQDEEGRPDDQRDQNQQIGLHVTQLQRDGEKQKRVELARIPHYAHAGGGPKQRQQHIFVVRILEEALGQRRLRAFALLIHYLENGRLIQLESNMNRESQENDRHDEWDAPTPLRKGLWIDGFP